MLLEQHSKPVEIAGAQGHRPAPRCPVSRIREPNEPLALLRLEELNERNKIMLSQGVVYKL